MSISAISYNILSSEFSYKGYHYKCAPKNLDSLNRIAKIKEILSAEIERRSIICLQEVSIFFAEHLHVLFQNSNYHVIYDPYGKDYSGYMGCMLAFPNDQFELKEAKIVKVGDELKKVIKKRSVMSLPLIERVLRYVFSDTWEKSYQRSNSFIVAKLLNKAHNKTFCIGTYHMPAEYELNDMIMIHASYIVNKLAEFAGSSPYILMGDFNFTPKNMAYKMITQGGNFSGFVGCSVYYDVKYTVQVNTPMKSVYFEKNGGEPQYTNHQHVRNQKEFCECIDYIYVSSGWQIDSIMPAPPISAHDDILPSSPQPSDHVMIGAILRQA
jgi:endonuclease/exonuclease/phosphatase family metal-dependent hydrolase